MRDFYKRLTDLIGRKGKQLNEKKKQAIKRVKGKDITGTCFAYSKHAAPLNICTNSKQLAKKEQEISEEVEQLSIQAKAAAEAERKTAEIEEEKQKEENERLKKEQEEKNERERKEQQGKQEKIEKEQLDRSSTFNEILTAFNSTSPTVFFDNIDPTL
jgi:flagellar biosynthesis GTPase FlhF